MTPLVSRPRLVAGALLAGLAVPAAAHGAAPPLVSTAPGRIVVQVDSGKVANNVDAGGAGLGVALPDRGVLLFGSGSATAGSGYVAKLGASGALDPAFGTRGVRSLPALPFSLLQILRQTDGRLLLVGAKNGGFNPGPLQVARLNADATLDHTYGSDGIATTAVGEGCGACTSAALQADGSLVLTGTTGEVKPPPAAPNLHWSLTRLTPSGAVDPGFGSGGVATIAPGVSASGFNVAIGPAGTIVTEAQTSGNPLSPGASSQLLLARLLPSGAPDPTFAGGGAVPVPFGTGFLLHVLADGSVLVNGQAPRTGPATAQSLVAPRRQFLARYTALGALDATFGSGGLVDLGSAIEPSQLLASAGRDVIVVGAPSYGLAPGTGPTPGRLNARLVSAGGAIALDRTVDLPFGGGGSSFLVSVRPRPVASLRQNSFFGKLVVRRSDGSYVVPGSVKVSQPTGEGTGFSTGRFAAAALTPSFALDPSFGGPARKLALSVRLTRQRASSAHARHGIRVTLRSSAVGLARVKVTHAGRAIALSLVPVFKTTSHTLPVELTSYGNGYLRHHRNVKVSVTAQARDLLTATKTAKAAGRLR
ncbi:MAG: hypothetical protein QOI73_2767 [Solirubrobacteraceae bacterium]|nr:hypothetical protein [Solirubrobacteraceae bacterium]